MPIGVPRIIYCWGEELPAQWTDIYNFIFRRRMVFLMQYLDDELCNQICGLLINIHMEDRSKELEKKEMERSGLFKSSTKQQSSSKNEPQTGSTNLLKQSDKSVDDLLASDEDLGIQDIDTLEQYTLQKITMEWLNWNAQFFDYSEEPYLFYLAETLSKQFNKNDGRMLYSANHKEMSRLMIMFKNMNGLMNEKEASKFFDKSASSLENVNQTQNHLDVYSPFRLLANFAADNYNLNELNPLLGNSKLLELFNQLQTNKPNRKPVDKLFTNLAQKNFNQKLKTSNGIEKFSQKALGQRLLRQEYTQDRLLNTLAFKNFNETQKSFNYLDFDSSTNSYNEFKDFYRKQTQAKLEEEEAKKVFVIINSFGGSVGNGITVHDALQFIKAGSLTLALGVAASAASLALAGGTIGERYVTEGCHVMIHQPESSLQGQASDIWIDSQEIMKIRLDVAEIYSLSTYRPRHKILRDLDRDFYLSATETIQYGLADEIATNEVMHSIVEMTNQVWDYHDAKQERLLDSRARIVSDSAQTQESTGG
uniref:ATP-dependent Clp protease proteolytic subunit n=1 Tax=Chlamydomonas chlamydogama TaxID=225041 RepID=UPI00226CEB00|nr:ATP-dependent Clp protease proteolytic subunit [Chlamydomonas chlamydogama]UZA61925.1 ATP-dependent Clp protease proteolytic subunit [Chlamydomonas chlamydogama]